MTAAQPGACRATFTVDGQRGNQKLLGGGIFTLQADDTHAETYLWEVTSSPPACDFLLTGATQPTARLSLPGPSAYVVQLTVTKGTCSAQSRVILWVATPVRLYRLPAASEPCASTASRSGPATSTRALLEVDHSLPTAAQKGAMNQANQPGAENPFATLRDVSGGNGGPVVPPGELTADEIAAIHAAEHPDADNRFITDSDRRKLAPTLQEKAALGAALDPHGDNAFVTESRLCQVVPTHDQREALDEAENPEHDNPFVTLSLLQRMVPTPEQRAALNCAENPGADNPLVTESRLKRRDVAGRPARGPEPGPRSWLGEPLRDGLPCAGLCLDAGTARGDRSAPRRPAAPTPW